MHKKRILIGLGWTVLPLTTMACASIHHSNQAKLVVDGKAIQENSNELDLVISGAESTEYSSPCIGLINFTFENPTEDWVTLRNLRFSFDKELLDAKTTILVGQKLATWADAVQHQDLIRRHNRRVALGTLAVVGGVASKVGAGTEDDVALAAGSLAALGALGSMGVADLMDHVRDLERPGIVPANHLLAGDLQIPPHLFAKRFLVLETSDPVLPRLERMRLIFEREDGTTQTVELPIRHHRSRWQAKGSRCGHRPKSAKALAPPKASAGKEKVTESGAVSQDRDDVASGSAEAPTPPEEK